ncbi:hypothetical protein N8469_00795 [bacterium]|jgi:hypothetical protein|nr:hypothetical protein [bacterium]
MWRIDKLNISSTKPSYTTDIEDAKKLGEAYGGAYIITQLKGDRLKEEMRGLHD